MLSVSFLFYSVLKLFSGHLLVRSVAVRVGQDHNGDWHAPPHTPLHLSLYGGHLSISPFELRSLFSTQTFTILYSGFIPLTPSFSSVTQDLLR